MDSLTVLGIETSCDETAAAIIRHQPSALSDGQTGADGPGEILANCIYSQIDDHAPFGGVVPEIAARSHISVLDRMIQTALDEAGCELADLDAIAATAGPGLIGGVMVGLVTGKTLALAADKPFIGINHLEGHALTARLCGGVAFPYLLLLVSGGHCQLLHVEGLGKYRLYGATLDDAAGEAFDKAAKLLGLGYPGGPAIEALAVKGNPARIELPRPLTGDGTCRFSFSGLKTALRTRAHDMAPVSEQDMADLAAGFQQAVIDCLVERTANAMQTFSVQNRQNNNPPRLVVAGGVAANRAIGTALSDLAERHGFDFYVAPPALCTDNAAMIAWAGIERLRAGQQDALDLAPRARWPLAELQQNTIK